jgi:excisionase family DNA binding protein
LKVTRNYFSSQQKENHAFLQEEEDRFASIENLKELPPVISVAEAADCLLVHPNTIYRMIRRGELLTGHCGKAIRISRDNLIALLNGDGSQSEVAARKK